MSADAFRQMALRIPFGAIIGLFQFEHLGFAHDKQTFRFVEIMFYCGFRLHFSLISLLFSISNNRRRSICRWSKIVRRQKQTLHQLNYWILHWHVLCVCDFKACTPHHIQVTAFNG